MNKATKGKLINVLYSPIIPQYIIYNYLKADYAQEII